MKGEFFFSSEGELLLHLLHQPKEFADRITGIHGAFSGKMTHQDSFFDGTRECVAFKELFVHVDGGDLELREASLAPIACQSATWVIL